jgi:hypothetical protein
LLVAVIASQRNAGEEERRGRSKSNQPYSERLAERAPSSPRTSGMRDDQQQRALEREARS